MGSLGLTFGGFREQEGKVREYRHRIQSCEPVGEIVNDQVSTVNFLYCHEDNAEGVRTGQRLSGTFGYLAAQLLSAREGYPAASYTYPGLLPQLRQEAAGPGDASGAPEGLCIGNPERIIQVIKNWESVGVDRIN